MYKRRTALIAILLVVGICAFSTIIVAHSDGLRHNAAHCKCQLCHIQHVAESQANAPAQIQFALHVVWFAAEEQPTAIGAAPIIRSNPRAPPA